MLRQRFIALALALSPMLTQAGELDPAIRCVHDFMTSPLLPATASIEQVASAAMARCADEIESAAIAIAGLPVSYDRLDASRVAVRRELHDYLAAGPVASASW